MYIQNFNTKYKGLNRINEKKMYIQKFNTKYKGLNRINEKKCTSTNLIPSTRASTESMRKNVHPKL